MRKRIILIFNLVCLSGFSQNGLENIIVEKYYVSDANDTSANKFGGKLPVGSTTFRIYADLLPGYRFQAAYGSSSHDLRIESTSNFYNNAEIGDIIANVIPYKALHKNTTMLDSWLSVGAGAEDCFGILKQDDDSLSTIEHVKVLKNKNKKVGIPLTKSDGLRNSVNVPRPTIFGIDNEINIFKATTEGRLFLVKNGAWACLGKGSIGPDSLTNNRILIAQLTTDGGLEFELNIQIGTPEGKSQRFVAKNPVENEILLSCLNYSTKDFKRKKKKIKNNNNNNNLQSINN